MIIRCAREHNLKNINVDLPRNKLIVVSGLSGSGKSSLAFDTIFAEGQRRYVESLSAYARQFLGRMDKPNLDYIEGLSPAISIEQSSAKTESLKKLYESQPFLFGAEEMGIKLENQCPEISDEDIAQALNDDLFDRKSERKKPGRTRNKSKNLPRQKYVIDLSEEEKICSNCGTKMVKVREIVSERIVHVPSSEYIEEVHRYVYECQNCLDDNDKPVRKVAKEKRIIEHSLATSELLAHIFISKYMKHTPFYCLEDTYNWQGICISRQNMCNWSLKVHERLKPLEKLLNSELKKTKLLMFDESPVEVLKVDSEELKAEYWDEARYRKKTMTMKMNAVDN